jgi:hypothetical protein
MKATKKDGGRVLERARITLVFLGDGWTAGLPSQADAEACFRSLLATPYMSYLAQYGIRRAEIVGTITGPTSLGKLASDPRLDLPQVQLISDKDITDALGAEADAHPRPAGEETLYMAVISHQTQPVFSDHLDAAGFHLQFEHAGRTYAYGAVPNWSGNTADNIWQSTGSLPATFAHELVEACSDPDGSTGYQLTPSQNAADPAENELSDYAGTAVLRLPGMTRDILLEGYWSNVHDAWVVPTGYSLRAALGQQAPQPVPNVKAALGGASSGRDAVRVLCT